MLRRAWRPVAVSAAAAGAAGYLYQAYTRPARVVRETFDIKVRQAGVDGKREYATKTLPLKSMADIDAMLAKHATETAVARPGGIVWKHATAQLASNSPLEDAHAEAIVERDPQPNTPQGDYLFFAVMDGHAGPYTSRLLSKTLIPAVALQLKELSDEPSVYAPKSTFYDNLKSMVTKSPIQPVPFDADPKYVSLAIQTAFAMLDSEIVNAPLRIIADHLRETKSKQPDVDALRQHPMGLAAMLPALSGSCAILALLDTSRRDLYVANTGDCRAVAGIWEEGPEGKGVWRVEVLSEDQTGRNPNELKRMQSEHPSEESDKVIQRGRVLGGLEPSRAFGDAVYKWPAELQKLLRNVFTEGTDAPLRRIPPDLKTPPYVTAQPVITHRKFSLPFPLFSSDNSTPTPTPSSPSPSSKQPELRFVVLATDGLWDELSSREVVSLVAGHLAGLRAPSVSKADLPKQVPTRISDDAAGVEGKDAAYKSKQDRTDGHWAFVDENIAQHLVRNAFGGADNQKLRRLLSIPAPLSRRFRDDVTVTVVWWEEGQNTPETQILRAKL